MQSSNAVNQEQVSYIIKDNEMWHSGLVEDWYSKQSSKAKDRKSKIKLSEHIYEFNKKNKQKWAISTCAR